MTFAHQHGGHLIEEYEGDFMRMNGGIVEIVTTRTFVSRTFVGKHDENFVSHVDEVVAHIALGPGESVKAIKVDHAAIGPGPFQAGLKSSKVE